MRAPFILVPLAVLAGSILAFATQEEAGRRRKIITVFFKRNNKCESCQALPLHPKNPPPPLNISCVASGPRTFLRLDRHLTSRANDRRHDALCLCFSFYIKLTAHPGNSAMRAAPWGKEQAMNPYCSGLCCLVRRASDNPYAENDHLEDQRAGPHVRIRLSLNT